jgi:hypothetical protein
MKKSLLTMCLSLLWAGHLNATTLPYKSFDNLVSESDGIVVGTVRSVQSQYDDKKDIHTLVTFDRLDVLHGAHKQTTLTLRLKGGQVNNEALEVEGSPSFRQNERIVLFVKGNGRELVPLVGWTQGMFRIVGDPVTRQEIVQDHEGNQVLGISGGHLQKERVHAAQAIIVGEPASVAGVAASSHARSGASPANPGTAENQPPPNVGIALASKAAPMPAQTFLSNVKAAVHAKAARAATALSVSEAEFASLPSNNDAAPSHDAKAIGANQSTSASTKPVLPVRAKP